MKSVSGSDLLLKPRNKREQPLDYRNIPRLECGKVGKIDGV